jgi:polar amino acid transport system substrate-binding protein
MRYWILLLLLCSQWVQSRDASVLPVTTLPDYAPFCFLYEGISYGITEVLAPGQHSQVLRGFSWEVVRESLHSQDYSLELTVQPWARAFRQANTEQGLAIFPLSFTEERQQRFMFSSSPVNEARYLVYVQRDNQVDWQGWSSFNGQRLALMRGYNYGVDWEQWPEIEPMLVDSLIQGFELLLLGRVSGFVGYEVTWDHHLRQRPRLMDKIRKLPPYATNQEFLALRNDTPDAEKILAAFERGYQQLRDSGRLSVLKIRYGIPE